MSRFSSRKVSEGEESWYLGIPLLQVSLAQSLFGVLLGSWGWGGGKGGGGYRDFRMDLDRRVEKEKREGR